MQYKFLGKSGLKVSEIEFGVQTFGWCTDEKTAHTMLDRFVGDGGNFIDEINLKVGKLQWYNWLIFGIFTCCNLLFLIKHF